jgi:hypothetical protein
MLNFTTFFDRNYLSRGLVLIDSLKAHCEDFTIYILCLDKFTLDYFQNNSNDYQEVKCLNIEEIENFDEDLFNCKSKRSLIEYYFTLSPCLPLYILKRYKIPHICSLDADIKFYSSPFPLFNYLKNHSIVITPHKFSKEIKDLECWGKYNVSFQIFKNDSIGIKCLEKWRLQCIDWCKDELDEENNRFADQKYLDDWNSLYEKNIKVLDDSVSGLAPWNLNNYKITRFKNKFYSNGEKLIFYHFHHNKFLTKNWASNGFEIFKVNYNKPLLKLYKNYWLDVTQKTISTNEEKVIRNIVRDNIVVQLLKENQVFFKIFNKIVFFINFKKMNRIIRKIILLIYARVNRN